ncbi:MAG: hypothetical protein LBE09_07940 [Christensenellaceae bacterium]|nr:hypothetical protein [Christensenellaceae bacterium]
MKNMTNSKCYKLGNAQPIKAFKDLRLKDGVVRVTDLERTVVDCIVCLDLSGWIEEVLASVNIRMPT